MLQHLLHSQKLDLKHESKELAKTAKAFLPSYVQCLWSESKTQNKTWH